MAKIAQVLGLDVSDINPEKPIHAYGNDSLVATDLKNWLTCGFDIEMQVVLLLRNTPIQEIAKDVALRSTRCSDERTEKV